MNTEKGLHGSCLNDSVLKILKIIIPLSFKVLFEDAVFKMFRILCTGRFPPSLLDSAFLIVAGVSYTHTLVRPYKPKFFVKGEIF